MPADERVPRHFGAACAALRIFFGLVFLTNGAAKLVPGPWSTPLGYLIDSNVALSVIRDAAANHPVAVYRELMQAAIIPNWPAVAVLLALFEMGIGALLVAGLATRMAALAGAGFGLHIQFMALSAGHWLFEHALLWVPLLALALLDAGVPYGADGLLRARREIGRERNHGG